MYVLLGFSEELQSQEDCVVLSVHPTLPEALNAEETMWQFIADREYEWPKASQSPQSLSEWQDKWDLIPVTVQELRVVREHVVS